MSKINNKLILVLGILIFIFGFLLASSAYAQNIGRGNIISPPYYYLSQDIPTIYYNSRSTTYSSPSSTTTSSSPNTTVTKNTNTSTSNNTISKTTDSSNIVVASDTNENYGSLAASAILGSNSFMPTGLVQWIILIAIVTAIIFLWRYVYAEEEYLSEPLKHA